MCHTSSYNYTHNINPLSYNIRKKFVPFNSVKTTFFCFKNHHHHQHSSHITYTESSQQQRNKWKITKSSHSSQATNTDDDDEVRRFFHVDINKQKKVKSERVRERQKSFIMRKFLLMIHMLLCVATQFSLLSTHTFHFLFFLANSRGEGALNELLFVRFHRHISYL